MSPRITTLLVVPHTHWDREWHQTFQQFRMRLVKCINLLLNILDSDPDFTYFMLDGQTIILDDYLEIHPEEAERLLTYVRAGRILIGPWYVQPDEFLVGGEAIIRNLLLGMRQAAPYGGAMPVGYVPDCFGHIAQLPQILRGFSIENVVFWRGIDPAVKQSEFWWSGPDGSRVLGVYLDGEMGYSNARELPLDPPSLLKRVEHFLERQGPRATTSTLLLMNGSDHLEPQKGLPAALAAANELLSEQDQRLVIGTLPQYIQAVLDAAPDLQTISGELRSSYAAHLLPGVLSARMWIKQRNAACEELLTSLVEPLCAWAWVLGGSYPSGLISAAWRLLLQNHPHDSICGTSIDQVHREMRARYDQCEQIAHQLVQDARHEILRHVDTQAVLPTVTEHLPEETPIPLVVINPVDACSSAVAELFLQVSTPPDRLCVLDEQGNIVPHVAEVTNGSEILNLVVDSLLLLSFLTQLEEGSVAGYYVVNVIFDENERDEQGNLRLWAAISTTPPAQRLYTQSVIERIRAILLGPEAPRWQVHATELPHVRLRFLARDLPACGGRTYLLAPRRERDESALESDLVASATTIENAWLRVEVSPADGTLTVTEKAGGAVYTGLNRFQDGGDVGDLYNWMQPAEDRLIDEAAQPPVIELLRADALEATLRITHHLMLPVSCSDDRQTRSSELVDCPIITEVSLISGGQMVQIHTTVCNRARDHRLRVLFPTPFLTETAYADGTFMVNERPLRREVPPEGWRDWIEDPVDTYPQKYFLSVSDEQRGLALLNRGLPEYEVLPAAGERGVVVALTLLRCVGWLSRGDLSNRRGPAGPALPTPEAQMEGEWSFDYALFPYVGTWTANAARVQQQGHAFNTSILCAPAGVQNGPLEPGWSFVRLEPAGLVLSTVKRAEDGSGLILRWYNPLASDVTADLTTALDFSRADSVSLNEEVRSAIVGESDAPTRHWRIPTPAGAILTVRLTRF
ncbi:MAG TPA: glycoside hydrolase family 38 C-terminal domain-containing protein [Ktedonobacteraceae bacterium]|nr:glycoside hydrolase family 38 C-terminal domain-containing protein [Ktedonobacteraceae bacterium]